MTDQAAIELARAVARPNALTALDAEECGGYATTLARAVLSLAAELSDAKQAGRMLDTALNQRDRLTAELDALRAERDHMSELRKRDIKRLGWTDAVFQLACVYRDAPSVADEDGCIPAALAWQDLRETIDEARAALADGSGE